MSQELAVIDQNDVFAIVSSAFGALEFGNLDERVNWQEVREGIDPRGIALKSSDLVDREFTIIKMKPVHSSLEGSIGHFYWVVGVLDDGQVFNSAIGGQACVEELDYYLKMQYEFWAAQQRGDTETAQMYKDKGAGRPATFTMRLNHGGKFGRYYTFD